MITLGQKTSISQTKLGHILLFCLCCYFGFKLLTTNPPWIILDGVNLMVHELGHLLTIGMGQFINILAGSLFQCLVPILIAIYFFGQAQWFALSFCLFWIGDNIVNVSAYIADANDQILPLINDSSIHDWNWLLATLNLINSAEVIGRVVYFLGAIVLITSLAWMLLLILTTSD